MASDVAYQDWVLQVGAHRRPLRQWLRNTQQAANILQIQQNVGVLGETLPAAGTNDVAVSLPLDESGGGASGTEAPTDGLQARFGPHPAWHTGMPFWTELHFSASPKLGYQDVRDKLFEVTGGRITRAKRLQQGSNAGWRLRVEPAGAGELTLELPATGDCSAEGAVCTRDGRRLKQGFSVSVEGPAAFSVSDAEVNEGSGAVLAFEVSLSRRRSREARVDVATHDGTAVAGADYEAVTRTLIFAPGETSKTVEVPVLDDNHDEGSETMTLVLSNASGARIADGRGASASVGFDPRPDTERGLAMSLTQAWGVSSSGGMDALLSRETLAGFAAGGDGRFAAAQRIEGRIGYGIARFGDRFTGVPQLRFGFSEYGREYRLGWRLKSPRSGPFGIARLPARCPRSAKPYVPLNVTAGVSPQSRVATGTTCIPRNPVR